MYPTNATLNLQCHLRDEYRICVAQSLGCRLSWQQIETPYCAELWLLASVCALLAWIVASRLSSRLDMSSTVSR